MTGLTVYLIGATARCRDGTCGLVSRVVIDPVTVTVTHLVVEPDDPHQLGRLVPLDLLGTRGDLARVHRNGVLPAPPRRVHAVPHAHRRTRRVPPGRPVRPAYRRPARPRGQDPGPQAFTYDVPPAGTAALRGDDPADALDGAIGHIIGVAVAAGSRQVAYLLLHAGHPLGKNIAIPISAVTRLDAGIQLNITKHDVKHLPPVDLQQPSR
jgi:hypothetical protein